MSRLQAELIDRVRDLLSGEESVREVPMFGGRSFMVNDSLVVSAWKNGDLLVRVPHDRHGEFASRPGASQAEMGAGRSMGAGWVSVSSSSIESDTDLEFWLEVAVARVR